MVLYSTFSSSTKIYAALMTIISRLVPLIEQLEAELRYANLWQESPPDNALLNSQVPFSADMIEPHQWLQWIFIVKIRAAIKQGVIPRGFAIEPYFSEVWKLHSQYHPMLKTLSKIDGVCQ
jgi:uncharacterized protein YqcC (DUF446 family)